MAASLTPCAATRRDAGQHPAGRRPARPPADLSRDPRSARRGPGRGAAPASTRCKLLMEDEFAVILLDVNMPGMDGFETASLIHQHPRFENTPIIFVTAVNVTDLDRLRGYKLGAVDYVMVPVIPEILRSKVSVLVELYRKRRELQVAQRAASSAANQALQLEKARELEELNESLREANDELARAQRRSCSRRSPSAIKRRGAAARCRPAQGRVPRHARARAAQSAGAAAECAGRASAGAPGDDDPLQDVMERQLAPAGAADRRPARRRAHHARQARRCKREPRRCCRTPSPSAIDSARPLDRPGGHALRTCSCPTSRCTLHADHARLSQVFANLLNNAAKYSDPGGRIELGAAVRRRRRSRSGCPTTASAWRPTSSSRIFELFPQVDTSVERSARRPRHRPDAGATTRGDARRPRRRRQRGPGTRQHVHGSCCRSATWRRTCRMRKPAPARPAADAGVPPRGCSWSTTTRDSADTLAMHAASCSATTRGPSTIRTTVEAEVARVRTRRSSSSTSACRGVSGYDVARSLRDRPGGRALTIVAVTGWGQPEDRRRTREAGFDHHLVKPPELEAIRRICAATPAATFGPIPADGRA